jgi:hypothetical protein
MIGRMHTSRHICSVLSERWNRRMISFEDLVTQTRCSDLLRIEWSIVRRVFKDSGRAGGRAAVLQLISHSADDDIRFPN